MKKIVTVQVGADGVLTLTLPLGKDASNKSVQVTVQIEEGAAGPTTRPADQEAWVRFIQQMAGSIPDPTFMRHPQGEYEERDPLP